MVRCEEDTTYFERFSRRRKTGGDFVASKWAEGLLRPTVSRLEKEQDLSSYPGTN